MAAREADNRAWWKALSLDLSYEDALDHLWREEPRAMMLNAHIVEKNLRLRKTTLEARHKEAPQDKLHDSWLDIACDLVKRNVNPKVVYWLWVDETNLETAGFDKFQYKLSNAIKAMDGRRVTHVFLEENDLLLHYHVHVELMNHGHAWPLIICISNTRKHPKCDLAAEFFIDVELPVVVE